MNCTGDLSAENWFYFRPDVLSEIIANISCWPWQRVGPSDWSRISSQTLASIFICGAVNQIFAFIASPIGIISSICSALSVRRKAVVEKERFYRYMLVIACLDLIFCTLAIPAALGFGSTFPSVYQYSYFWSIVYRIFTSLVFTISLVADLCTLMLTFERFVAVCKPTSYNKKGETLVTGFSVIIVLTVSTARFLSAVLLYKPAASATDETGRVTYIPVPTEISQTLWFTCLLFFSQSVLPFLLLFSMLYLSLRIGYVIVKRRKSRIQDSASVQQQQAVQQQSTGMLRLLAILVVLYVVNQLILCIYIIQSYAFRDVTVDYGSSEVEINYFVSVKYLAWVLSVFGTIWDGFARCSNFFLYCIFTETMRQEFRRALGFRSNNEPVRTSKTVSTIW